MKTKAFQYLSFLLLSLTVLATSCQKGEDITGTGYGKITVQSTLTGDPGDLLVNVDGVTKDTLNINKQSIAAGIVTLSGERKFSIVKQRDNSVLYEGTLNVKTGISVSAPPFLYDGTVAFFDDLDAKPQIDSMLVRFINQVPSFPDVVNFQIKAFTIGGTDIKIIKTINGVRKDKFSEFVQLPNITSIIPTVPGKTATYFVTATDPANNNAELIPNSKYAAITVGTGRFLPNGVVSIGIKPPSRSLYEITRIFERTVQ